MNPDQIKAAIEAIKNQDAEAALQILEDAIAAAAGAPASGGAESGDALPEGADPAPETAAALAASRELLTITGAETVADALGRVRNMAERSRQADADRAALELDERRGLVADLVRLGAETPATAWQGANDTERAQRNPVARLAAEPMATLRERRNALSAARPAVLRAPTRRPDEPSSDVTALSAAEIAACAKKGIKPEDYATRKANAVRRVG